MAVGPLVSIGMPIHNEERFQDSRLTSLRQQDYPNPEIVIQDNAFISIFAPQGIGMFESVAGIFLQGRLTFAAAAVLAAGIRVAIPGADMLGYSGLLVVRYAQRTAGAGAP